MLELALELADEAATQALGAALAASAPHAGCMTLRGDLGAGKTTLVRAFLRQIGYNGRVVSPTYTLVERYDIGARHIAHYDLYRLNDPEELEWMGAREDFGADTLSLIEWPDHGAGMLPPADLEVFLQHEGLGRKAHLLAHGAVGEPWLNEVNMLLKKNNISSSFD